jgi:diguanylate cyclase (GGDEF)-like protein
LLALAALCAHGVAHAMALEVGGLDASPVVLTRHLAVLRDTGAQMDLDAVQAADREGRFVDVQTDVSDLRLGYTSAAVWLRLRLTNAGPVATEHVLELAYAQLARAELFRAPGQGMPVHQVAGTGVPFAQHPIAHRHPTFQVSVPAQGEAVLYLRVQAISAIVVPARLWRPQDFSRYQRNDYAAQAAYLGMAAAMLLFNLLLYLALRDRTYLLYVFFVGAFSLSIATQMGLAQEYLWTDSPRWSVIANYMMFSMAVASLAAFARQVLETARVLPHMDRVLSAAQWTFLCSPLAIYWIQAPQAQLAVASYLAGLLLVLGAAFLAVQRGQRSGHAFMIAFLPTVLGSFVTAARGTWLMPTNFWTVNGMQIGSALEMVLLAFALAHRFNKLRAEKTTAQAEVLQAKSAMLEEQSRSLQAQAALIAQLRQSERTLEQRVRERTKQLQVSNQKLRVLSTTDGLTGIFNRRHFDAVLQAECHRAQRSGQALTVAMLDIDWFKHYNDHYGHPAGDACLKQVADLLVSCMGRAGDTVARYGGEEFAFIAPNTDAQAAVRMARRLCEAVRQMGWAHAGSPRGLVTVSMGVVTCVPTTPLRPEHLLRAADQALYRAKQQGRDRFEVMVLAGAGQGVLHEAQSA